MAYIISSGATSSGIVLNSYDSMYISNGGTANSTTVNSGGWLNVFSGGTANSTTIDSGGLFYVLSGGTAAGNTVNADGDFYVASGGTATGIAASEGATLRLTVAPNTYIQGTSDGSAFEMKNAMLSGHTIKSRTMLYVKSGGAVNDTTVSSGGMIYVSSGGSADSTMVNSSGYLTVSSGGTANSTTVNSFGYLYVSSGGTANNTIIGSGGAFFVFSGGSADKTTVNADGIFYVISGGTATGIAASDGATLRLTVAPNTYIQGFSDGNTFEMKNALLSGFSINSGTGLYVESGGTLKNATVNSGGDVYVSSGGTAVGAILNFYGFLRVSSGGVANNTTFNSGGNLIVSASGTANSTTVKSGNLYVSSGGTANSTTVKSGNLIISSGGTANDTTLQNKGYLYVSGGTLNGTTVISGGCVVVSGSCMANSLIVSSGGIVVVTNGGFLSGHISIERDADMIMDQSAVLDFDLTQTSAGASAIVNGFSRITGDASYTLTVGADQPAGIYQLAQDVYVFDKTISVVNSSGATLGALSLGQTVNINGMSYALSLNSNALFLSIREPGAEDTVAPAVFSVRQNHGDPTLRPVTVTAEFADDVDLKFRLYRIGENGAWTDYDGGVILNENATVYFKAVDASGNESEVVSHTVTNIEKNAHDPVYVYLDFDGETTSYINQDMNLSFAVTVADPGYTDTQKLTIQAELADRYAADGVAFTLTRPENTEYSTLYFGKSDDFADYGRYFGISETLDACNRIKNDNAFILLDSTYSLAQTISVAETALNHIMGYTCSPMGELQLRDYAVNSYLLSTQWNQNDPYNKYCPVDPRTGDRCPTGCVNTAAAQIIYYWIENGMLDISLTLEDSDTLAFIYDYVDGSRITIDADPLTAAEYGYLSFAKTNDLLSNFKLDDMDSIAALSFAAGIVNGSSFTYNGTETAGSCEDIFLRVGFQNTQKNFYRNGVFTDFIKGKNDSGLSDLGLEIMIRELLAGRPVLVCTPAHEYVIDGYNSATGEFHINYGWGGENNKWYNTDHSFIKRLSMIAMDLMPEVFPELSVSGLSFEQDAVKQGKDVIVNVSMSNSGNVKSSESMAYVYAGDTLLSSQVLDFLYPGETRVFSLTVDSTGLSLGENAITVRVDSPDSEKVLFSSQTIEVLENVMLNAQFYTGDFDGDLFDTLAVQSGSTVTIYRNGEPWGFGLTLDAGWSIAGTGDFNADGLDDFLRVHSSGLVMGDMSSGNGLFSSSVLNFKNAGWDILGTGNFDGVGPDDVLIANPTAASETVGLLGYWKGGTEWTLINGYSPEWTMVSTGDFNGDGKCDMLWKNSFVGDGGLTYNAYCTWIVENEVDWRMVSVANPSEWNFLCSGDFDGNGSHDIAMINDVGVVGIWGVTDGYLSSWSILSAVTSEWQIAGVADFNADGTDDIAWSNTDTGLTGYWQINDKQLTTWANIATLS